MFKTGLMMTFNRRWS